MKNFKLEVLLRIKVYIPKNTHRENKDRQIDKSTFTKNKEREYFCVLKKVKFLCKLIQAEMCQFAQDLLPINYLKTQSRKLSCTYFLNKSQSLNIIPSLRLIYPSHLQIKKYRQRKTLYEITVKSATKKKQNTGKVYNICAFI